MTSDKIINSDLDYTMLDRELDRTKARVFTDKNYAGFLGSILCKMTFMWSTDVGTACTNGLTMQWNPYWFLKLPPKTRLTVLVHEIWHTARLDHLRLLRPGVDLQKRNVAMDIKINNDLKTQGYSFEGTDPCIDFSFEHESTEEVYDALVAKEQADWEKFIADMLKDGFDGFDMEEADEENKISPEELMETVVQAATASRLSGDAGDLPGEVKLILKRFLKPKIPWGSKLHRFFQDIGEEQFVFNPPNRSYPDHLLPSEDEGDGLDHLLYFKDTSLSVTDAMVLRFTSELKYVKELYNPKKMTIAQFDTQIHKIMVLTEEDPFEEMVIEGRGGTSLQCVHDLIIEQKPTAVIIFSDLQCRKMPVIKGVPIIWVCLNNPNAVVDQGEIIHLRE